MNKPVARDELMPTASLLALADELSRDNLKSVGHSRCGDLDLTVAAGHDSLWLVVRQENKGGLALRTAYVPTGNFRVSPEPTKAGLSFKVESPLGVHRVVVGAEAEQRLLRIRTTLTVTQNLQPPIAPRDLYPLDGRDDPIGTRGEIYAAQRGVNSALTFFAIEKPDFGTVLYFQNLTALNDYSEATGTVPSGVVGGSWPELGYQPARARPNGEEIGQLPAGHETVLSDVRLVFRDGTPRDEQAIARRFLQMLGTVYPTIEKPPVEFRDWHRRAEMTLRDLQKAPAATVRYYGHRYVMPYVQGEVPDNMVQMTVIAALHDYGRWQGKAVPLTAQLKRGLGRFYDPERRALRRFLPNVGAAKDKDAVDSWYLYHPLVNLARLALDGDDDARALLLKSADYGIKAAHHFNYRWPIQYRVNNFEIITATRADHTHGQTDVGGLYAYLMLQLHQLTAEGRYLDEAKAAIEAAKGLQFALMYQANLSLWGAVACVRLWRHTQDEDYLRQSYVYLAGFFHNCEIWESEIGVAQHHRNFLGATCLHDAPYMAIYECFESFAAFDEYLAHSGPDLDPAVRLLSSEYCRYALDRAWFYYPDALPAEAIFEGEHQSGKIDPKLSFPLEDLYADGQPCGKVGQEIFGCGAAFIFATRSLHTIEGAPFQLFCDEFVRAADKLGNRTLSLQLDGGENVMANLRLLKQRGPLPQATLCTASGVEIAPVGRSRTRIDFAVPAQGRLILRWQVPARPKAKAPKKRTAEPS